MYLLIFSFLFISQFVYSMDPAGTNDGMIAQQVGVAPLVVAPIQPAQQQPVQQPVVQQNQLHNDHNHFGLQNNNDVVHQFFFGNNNVNLHVAVPNFSNFVKMARTRDQLHGQLIRQQNNSPTKKIIYGLFSFGFYGGVGYLFMKYKRYSPEQIKTGIASTAIFSLIGVIVQNKNK